MTLYTEYHSVWLEALFSFCGVIRVFTLHWFGICYSKKKLTISAFIRKMSITCNRGDLISNMLSKKIWVKEKEDKSKNVECWSLFRNHLRKSVLVCRTVKFVFAIWNVTVLAYTLHKTDTILLFDAYSVYLCGLGIAQQNSWSSLWSAVFWCLLCGWSSTITRPPKWDITVL